MAWKLRLSWSCLLLAVVAGPAWGKEPDPAARGLDVFVHGASSVVSGDVLALDLKAYGFFTVTATRPLPGAEIVAVWNPESLGHGVMTAPGAVSVKSDALGDARLDVPVPDGEPRKLELLVSVRHGEHTRNRTIEVSRTARRLVTVSVPDRSVVPGSRVPAWVTVTDARTGSALRGAPVDVTLLEGDFERTTVHVTTDSSGFARTWFLIPAGVTGAPPMSIRGRLAGDAVSKDDPPNEAVRLTLREENPATPKLLVKWRELALKPSETGHAAVSVLDAAGEPLGNHAVVYWIGPRGTSRPATEDAWRAVGKVVRTDGLGTVEIEATAPRIVPARGSDLTLVTRTEIEGQWLEATQSLSVDQPAASATVLAEGGALVPGTTQRIYLSVDDGDRGVAGDFVVEADGLRGVGVTTDEHGAAELTWAVPEDVGARRENGDCAGGVAATLVVRPRLPIPRLARHPEPFHLCVAVDRERRSLLRSSVQVARSGDKIHATLIPAAHEARGVGSVVVRSPEGVGTTTWTDARAETDIDLTNATPGVHEITLALPQASKPAVTASTRVLVAPRVLPKISGKVVGGKVGPGGEVEIDVTVSDGKGAPLPSAVTAVTIDKEGGGDLRGLWHLDARRSLCDAVKAPTDRCDAFLEGDASAEHLRRSALTTVPATVTAPLLDPTAHTTEALRQTFSAVLHSLEGAVYRSDTPEGLRDVRRKEAGGWRFNPELMTLVTSSMSEPPTTPGGEPFGLPDLIAVDPQVTFDNVARRVTRLELFRVLEAVRAAEIPADEPALRDPNAILRQLVRAGSLSQERLVDPWGGTIQFVRTSEPPLPFLTVRGFALHAPGPDGRIGTPDDVRDPFERVVHAKTPYSDAMGEDEIVDARASMRMSQATVDGWKEMFARLTGTELGGLGESSGGQGFGAGHGSMSGHGAGGASVRTGASIVTETARWTEPMRTDAQGHARLRVQLGDYETTWQVALLARTDAGQNAVTMLDVPAFLPLSAHADAGKRLTLGDAVSARIVVRNRTASAKSVALDVTADGALALDHGQGRTMNVEVPARSVRSAFVRLLAQSEGKGRIGVTLRAPGSDGDSSVQEIEVAPAGEERIVTASRWPSGKESIAVNVPAGYALRGTPRLVIDSGIEDSLAAALDALEPRGDASVESLADAIEVAARVAKLAEARNEASLGARAKRLSERAQAYLRAQTKLTPRSRAAVQHAALFAPTIGGKGATPAMKAALETPCPVAAALEMAPMVFFLEAEPVPGPTGPEPCFSALMAKVELKLPLELARAVLALSDRPHRAALASTLAETLAKATHAETGEPSFDGTRAERAIVLSALARSAGAWTLSPDRRPAVPGKLPAARVGAQRRLVQNLMTLRDVHGGYGSSEATRDVVRALVATDGEGARRARVSVTSGDRVDVVDVGNGSAKTVTLGDGVTRVDVAVVGDPVLVRLERPLLRRYVAAPDTSATPVLVSTDWPADARAGTTGVVHVKYTALLGRHVDVWTQLPLPPGVELAAPTKDVTVRQGVIHVRTAINGEGTIVIPVRFTLAGVFLVREAETVTTSEEEPRTLTPARGLVVR